MDYELILLEARADAEAFICDHKGVTYCVKNEEVPGLLTDPDKGEFKESRFFIQFRIRFTQHLVFSLGSNTSGHSYAGSQTALEQYLH